MLRAVPLFCLLAALGVIAPVASAATIVEVGDAFPGDPVQPGVLITDEDGLANELTVTYKWDAADTTGDGTVMVHEERAALDAGEGCTEADGVVRCEVQDLRLIRALLGGGDDSALAVSPPRGMQSCGCVELRGGVGNDVLVSRDGATLYGETGHDKLIGEHSTAQPAPAGARQPNGEEMSGGGGNDRLDAGIGPDFVTGDGGEDHLDGGPGDDQLSDGDYAAGEIGPDTIIGGTDEDIVQSYSDRTGGVKVDLSTRGGDGELGENDDVFNVEVVYGGSGDDRLIGDGDANVFWPLRGKNRVSGRGGDDAIFLTFRNARNSAKGGRGDDVIEIEAFETGPMRCGPGRDSIAERQRGSNADRRVDDDEDRGPWISATCEELQAGVSIDPVPDEAPSGRFLHFDRFPGSPFGSDLHLDLTAVAPPPFKDIASGQLTRGGVTLKLPAGVARRARRGGFQFRAEAWDERFAGPQLRLLWRFRQRPAR